tara:strand:+ start:204 stop:668 length:465 start_codon:yes stop_codon:yes gene_type:complete
MKAILGNFTKISDSIFHLKKNLQFAQVLLDDDGNISTVNYKDKQNIEIHDILTHQDIDYEIISINTDDMNYMEVNVKRIVQEQDVPDKSNFIARKMSPRKVVTPIEPKVESNILDTKQENITEPKPIQPKPKKRNLIKRIASWISSKLSVYSNS